MKNTNKSNNTIKGMSNRDNLYKPDMKLLQLDNVIEEILRDCTPEQKIEYLQIIINKISDDTLYNREN